MKSGVDAIPDPDSVKDNLDLMKDNVGKLDDVRWLAQPPPSPCPVVTACVVAVQAAQVRDNTETFRDLLISAKQFLWETLPPLFDSLSVRPGRLLLRWACVRA